MLTFQEVKKNEAIRTYIQRADESLTAWDIRSTVLPM